MANRHLVTGGANVVWDATNTSIWSATAGGAPGASVPGPSDDVIMNASSGGGSVTLAYNPNVISITCGNYAGTFDAATYSPTLQTFSYSGSGVRTIRLGSGTWTITGNAATVWNGTTTTNLTLDAGTSTIDFTYSGSTGTRTITMVTLRVGNVKISAGTDTVALGGLQLVDLDFTGFAGTVTGSTSINTSGSLTLSSGLTWNNTGAFTFSSTSSETITLNGKTLGASLTINGVGGTLTLQDAFSSTSSIIVTNGSIDTNDFSVTASAFTFNNNNTKGINIENSTVTLTGTSTVWNSGFTGTTFVSTNSSIILNNTSATIKRFRPLNLAYKDLWFVGGGTGVFQMGLEAEAANDFNSIKIDPGLTVNVFAGITINFNSLLASGTSGNLITFASTTAGVAWNFVKTSGMVNVNYVSLQDSAASGGATFYAGNNSTNVSGNSGWNFSGFLSPFPQNFKQ